MRLAPSLFLAGLLLSLVACAGPIAPPLESGTALQPFELMDRPPVETLRGAATSAVPARAVEEVAGTRAVLADEQTGSDRWSGIVLRVEVQVPEKRTRSLGTGFVVQDRGGNCYLLTCAHLLSPNDADVRNGMTIRTMDGKRSIDSLGPSVHVGTGVDLSHPMRNGWPDMTRDLIIRTVSASWVQPLPLAAAGPQVGDWVWAVGCEARKPLSDEQLFPGRVIQVSGGGYVMEKRFEYDPHGFSGGPVINRRGEVVGTVLAGGGTRVSGATVGAIRQRLTEHGIFVD
jgi:S1-C subfamily serine protease